MTFEELGLRSEILKGLADLGFEKPTPIQEQAIPELMTDASRDLVGLAQTGTGKTAAFGLPMLSMIDFDNTNTQGLVIAPTRELCLQICNDFNNFAKHIKGANIVPIYGGAAISTQARQVRKGAQVIVATPGRLVDMIKQGIVKLKNIDFVVLDEADEMLNMGFKDDLDAILSQTPDTKVTWLFSATMPREVARIAKSYMADPFEITVGTKNKSAENIEHSYYTVSMRDKYPALKRILDINPKMFGLVFCRTKRDTQQVADNLMRDGYNAEPLHGDLSQMQRDQVMAKFRDRTLQILVATDVAARGIDVDDITHVINYSLPEEISNYTHRSGRTARAGRHGESTCLVGPKDGYKIRQIEKIIGKSFTKKEVPTGKDICAVQLLALLDKFKNVEVSEKDIEEFMPEVMSQFEESSKEEILKRFVSFEFNRFIDYYKGAKDIKANERGSRDRDDRDRNDRGRDRGDREHRRNIDGKAAARFHVSIGEDDGMNKGALVRMICDNANITSKEIGRIDMRNEFCFFEVQSDLADSVLKAMDGADFDGNDVRVEPAKPRRNEGGDRGRGRSKGGFASGNGGGGDSRKRSFDRRSSSGKSNNSSSGSRRRSDSGGGNSAPRRRR